MRHRLLIPLLVGPLAAPAAAQRLPEPPALTAQASGTTALLQAVSVVDDRVVWVSGHRATWAVTTNGGETWAADSMTGPDSALQFRDVYARSATEAWLLAAGPGDASRIYHTEDGGRHWTLQFRNRDSSAFYDCLDFWDARRGIAVSDAVRGHMVVITTDDGGATWTPVPEAAVPPALPGEGAPAASGTCLVTRPGGRAWFGTEAESGARVYATLDYGRTWRVVETPIVHGQASGIASLAMRDDAHGFVLGGRILEPRDTSVAVATTADGGLTWTATNRPPFTGPVFGSALAGRRLETLVAVGPKGLAIAAEVQAALPSPPLLWTLLSSDAHWAVAARGNLVWAVGPGGRITHVDLAPGR